MSEKKQLQVEAIRNGSVIDHIPAGQGIKILKLFGPRVCQLYQVDFC